MHSRSHSLSYSLARAFAPGTLRVRFNNHCQGRGRARVRAPPFVCISEGKKPLCVYGHTGVTFSSCSELSWVTIIKKASERQKGSEKIDGFDANFVRDDNKNMSIYFGRTLRLAVRKKRFCLCVVGRIGQKSSSNGIFRSNHFIYQFSFFVRELSIFRRSRKKIWKKTLLRLRELDNKWVGGSELQRSAPRRAQHSPAGVSSIKHTQRHVHNMQERWTLIRERKKDSILARGLVSPLLAMVFYDRDAISATTISPKHAHRRLPT